MSGMKIIETQLLVVGGGVAGCVAALAAADKGTDVLLLHVEAGASRWAQGGIVYRGAGDPSALVQDILQAGAHKNYRPAVDLVAQQGPALIDRWLRERLGVEFDVSQAGELDLALEAAHQSHRILHVKDATGAALSEKCLVACLAHPKIKIIDGEILDLLLSNRHNDNRQSRYEESHIRGAYVYREETVQAIVAQGVLLATGGFSQLYSHSTGPESSRGDGIAVAHRAGARTLDLEYVQFHPTALYIEGEPRRLLTEALRGSGARLLNSQKETFVDELGARDGVARAIHEELIHSGAPHVWMDLRPVADFENKFPSILKLLQSRGLDAHHDLIPVVPAAHYTIGGVWTDLHGQTNVPGLWAAGEVACTGLHGANRLASTSLLECLVFGERAGQHAAQHIQNHKPASFVPRQWQPEHDPIDPALMQQDWQLLKHTLWNYIGLVRSGRRLLRAEKIIVELRREVESFYRRSRLCHDLIGLRNALLVATLLLYSAIRNTESVGTHYLREDY